MNDPKVVAAYEELLTLRQENARLKAQLEDAMLGQFHPDIVNSHLAELDKTKTECNELKAQLDQFHAAMDKEKDPKWSEELRELANLLTFSPGPDYKLTYLSPDIREQAARQLRYMADCFTHKSNFVPIELDLKEAQTDRDDARKEAAKTLVQLGKVENQRDECLGVLRVLQPQVKMWLAGSSEYEWIGKLLEGRFGEGIYKPK